MTKPENTSKFRPSIDTNSIRSFGRVKSRKLNSHQEKLLTEVLPPISISIKDDDKNLDLSSFFNKPPNSISFEIGFGGGEHLAGIAKNDPKGGFIGCEPFTNGVSSLLGHIKDDGIDNIKIFHGDARLLLNACKDSSLDKVYILFPDPWPKSKHHKKRIISQDTLDIIHRVMKNDAELLIATDHVDYSEWISDHLDARRDFIKVDRNIKSPPCGWIPTRYQEKAEKEGRFPVFFLVRCCK